MHLKFKKNIVLVWWFLKLTLILLRKSVQIKLFLYYTRGPGLQNPLECGSAAPRKKKSRAEENRIIVKKDPEKKEMGPHMLILVLKFG